MFFPLPPPYSPPRSAADFRTSSPSATPSAEIWGLSASSSCDHVGFPDARLDPCWTSYRFFLKNRPSFLPKRAIICEFRICRIYLHMWSLSCYTLNSHRAICRSATASFDPRSAPRPIPLRSFAMMVRVNMVQIFGVWVYFDSIICAYRYFDSIMWVYLCPLFRLEW